MRKEEEKEEGELTHPTPQSRTSPLRRYLHTHRVRNRLFSHTCTIEMGRTVPLPMPREEEHLVPLQLRVPRFSRVCVQLIDPSPKPRPPLWRVVKQAQSLWELHITIFSP